MNPDHRPVAEQLGEQPKRSAVVRIVERGRENRAVGDVEIGVTRRKPLAVEVERRGQRQGDDLDLRAVFEPHPFEPLAILLQRSVIDVAGIGLVAEHHGARVDEAAQVVDMPVRVVAGDTLAQPQHVRDAQVVAEGPLELGARQPGVAHLDLGVEQALLGGEERATAVHVDASPLQHHVALAGARAKHAQAEPFRDSLGHLVVLLPVGILGPAGEAEARDGEFGPRRRAPHEEGAEITGPAAVGGDPEELDAGQIHARTLQHAPGLTLVRDSGDKDPHDLARRELAHDLAVHPRDRADLARPVACLVRPADPCGVMRLPLGGHAEPEGGW